MNQIVADNNWRLIVPVASTNYVLNPSAEIAGNFADIAGATTSRETTYQKFGLYSYYMDVAAANDGTRLTLTALTNTEHYVTIRVRKPNPTLYATLNATTKELKFIEKINKTWDLYGVGFSATEANGATALDITVGSAVDFYFDGVQAEPLNYWTTYIDGNQEGCEWNGAQNASTSTRSALSRAGGRPVDLFNEYGFMVQRIVGAAATGTSLTTDSYAILPGGELNSEKIESRDWSIVGKFIADSEAELHDNIENLRIELSNDKYPGLQQARIRFNGSYVQKEISVNYRGGLEGNLPAYYDCYEVDGDNWKQVFVWQTDANIQLLSPDPFWYEIGNSAAVLDTNDSATLRYMAGRLKSTGQWDDLGLTDNPTANGLIYDVLVASDGSVYFGGDFDGIDNNVPVGGDNIIRYDPVSNDFNLLVGASDVNSIVVAISEGPDKKIYICGYFTAVNGDGTADYIVAYNPSTDTWESLGDPNSGGAVINHIDAMAWDSAGNLYIGGRFTDLAGVANADYFAKWDGASWTAVGSGGQNSVKTIAINSKDEIYIGGDFVNWAGDANADYWAWWNGTSWAAVDDIALNGTVSSMEFDKFDNLYVGGSFSIAGGNPNANYIFMWTGSKVIELSSSTNGSITKVKIAPDGLLFAAGSFTEAGSFLSISYFAVWNGYVWWPLDVNLPGVINQGIVDFGNSDSVVDSNYDIFIGFSTTGTGYFSGVTEISNIGTSVSPKIYINRSGGTLAKLRSIRNEDTGKRLLLDYDLLDGETFSIDFTKKNQSVISDFFGSRQDAILANSDLGSFDLLPGNNNISVFVDVTGAPTITAWLEYRTPYASY